MKFYLLFSKTSFVITIQTIILTQTITSYKYQGFNDFDDFYDNQWLRNGDYYSIPESYYYDNDYMSTPLLRNYAQDIVIDPMVEEKVDVVMSRAIRKRRKVRDGLGKKLSAPNCGEGKDLEERIVNGRIAAEGAYPWVVIILRNGNAHCGGAILNDRWIVTAAHCFDDRRMTAWSIRVGTLDKNKGRTYKISKVITHKRYNWDSMKNSDIALLKTSSSIEFNELVQPICLPENSYDEPKHNEIFIAGWGETEFASGSFPELLQEIKINVVNDGECAVKYKSLRYTIYKSQMCTWDFQKDACQGDSGGPIIEIYKDKAYIVGAVSYGRTCADDYPGVNTQISYYLTWISATMEKNKI